MCLCFKQKTAYEMRISDWSSDVCSSDIEFADLQILKQQSAIILTFRKPAAVPSPVNLQAEPDRIALLTHDLRLFFLLTDNDADPAERLQNTRRLAATAGVKALHGQAIKIGRAHVRTQDTHSHTVC